MKQTLIIIVLILFGVVVLQWQFMPSKMVGTTSQDTTIYVIGDSSGYDVEVDPFPEPIFIELPGDPSPVIFTDTGKTILPEIDSAKVYAEFHARYHYHDSISDSASQVSVVEDLVISQNRIIDRKLTFYNNRPLTIHSIKQTEPPPWRIYAGAGIGGSQTQFQFSPAVAAMNRKQQLYIMQYDVINKTFQFTTILPILKL